jgi:hypothetical protein
MNWEETNGEYTGQGQQKGHGPIGLQLQANRHAFHWAFHLRNTTIVVQKVME